MNHHMMLARWFNFGTHSLQVPATSQPYLIGAPAGGVGRGRVVRVHILKQAAVEALHAHPDVDRPGAVLAVGHIIQLHQAVLGLHVGTPYQSKSALT